MPPVSVSLESFLRAIWGEGPGIAELTSIGPKGLKSFPFAYPDSLQSLISIVPNHNKESNVYMGVVLRKEKWPRANGKLDADGKPAMDFRGTEENALSSMCVAFAEIDFTGMGHKVNAKTIPEEEAKKRLHEFPRKPSIVIKSGGGIQMYWLGKEPISGDELWRMKAINKAICKHLGADTQSVDLARILRIPGSMNVKYDPPRLCHITYWHPEHTYTLDDFDFLPVEDPRKSLFSLVPGGLSGSPQTPPGTNPVLPNTPGASSRPNPAPTVDLTEDQIAKIGEMLGGIWVSGMRHEMALCIAGMLVNRGVTIASARNVVARASNKAGGETDKRLADVDSTYKTWYQNEKVKGVTELEKVIREHTPVDYIEKALNTLEKVKKALPKVPSNNPPGGGGGDHEEPDFKIVKLIMFNSKPARWQVTLEFLDGSQHTGSVETTAFTRYLLFRDAFLEDSKTMLMDLKNATWTAMIKGYGPPEVRDTPKEARPLGAVETALSEFLEEAKENAEGGTLRAFAGFDDDSQYFRYAAFDNFMKGSNLRFDRHVVYDLLKQLKFENTTRRFGKKTVNVWIKKALEGPGTNGNGNGNGNGHPHPDKPVLALPVPSPSKEEPVVDTATLFDLPQDPGSGITPKPIDPETPDAVTDVRPEPGWDG